MKQEALDLLEQLKAVIERDYDEKDNMIDQLAEKLGEMKKEKRELIKEIEITEDLKEVKDVSTKRPKVEE